MRRGIRVLEWKRDIWKIQSREHNEDDALGTQCCF